MKDWLHGFFGGLVLRYWTWRMRLKNREMIAHLRELDEHIERDFGRRRRR